MAIRVRINVIERPPYVMERTLVEAGKPFFAYACKGEGRVDTKVVASAYGATEDEAKASLRALLS